MQCASCLSLSRQLTRSVIQHGRSLSRSFVTSSTSIDSVKPPEAIIDSKSSRIFLSSPLREGGSNGDSSSRKYVQAEVKVITPVHQPGSECDDFKLERLHDKLKKVELCKKYNLQPRDLGALEVDIVGRRAQIFVRPGSIVYSADVRAIIRKDKLLLFENQREESNKSDDPDVDADADVQKSKLANSQEDVSENDKMSRRDEARNIPDLAEQVMKEMRRISLQGRQTFGDGVAEGNPFEFIALEALLAQTAKELFKTSDSLQERYADLMQTLKVSDQIPTSALQKMLELKDSVEEFKSTSEEFRQAVAEILAEEADMAQMYLTDIHNGKAHTVGDDDEIELLLEMYRHHAYSLTDLAATLLTRLQSITNHVTLLLSSTRNRLLNLEISIAFTTLGTSVGALIGALFGMNLTSGLEETPYMFGGMSALAVVLALIVARWGRNALKRARSVKGEQEGLFRHSAPGLRRRFERVQAQKTMR